MKQCLIECNHENDSSAHNAKQMHAIAGIRKKYVCRSIYIKYDLHVGTSHVIWCRHSTCNCNHHSHRISCCWSTATMNQHKEERLRTAGAMRIELLHFWCNTSAHLHYGEIRNWMFGIIYFRMHERWNIDFGANNKTQQTNRIGARGLSSVCVWCRIDRLVSTHQVSRCSMCTFFLEVFFAAWFAFFSPLRSESNRNVSEMYKSIEWIL